MQNGEAAVKTRLVGLHKIKGEGFPMLLQFHLWGDAPKNWKQGLDTIVHNTLFIHSRLKGENNPDVHGWMNGQRITMEYCSTLKWNEVLTHALIWMSLEDMLSQIWQTQKAVCSMALLTGGIWKSQIQVKFKFDKSSQIHLHKK